MKEWRRWLIPQRSEFCMS